MLDETVFLAELEALKKPLYNFARHNLYTEGDEDDVFSEAVLTAWERRQDFVPGTSFKSWIYRILLNKIYSANRRRTLEARARSAIALAPAVPNPMTPENSDLSLEQCGDELRAAVLGLNETEREAFLMLALAGMTYAEIAAATDAPEGTVLTRLARARAKLRERLGGRLPQGGAGANAADS
jgi:RNA polymerase sigma-70 factor (ECF subfamily)